MDEKINTQKVEVYLGYANNTWDTAIVEIPGNTSLELLEQVAEREAIKLFFNNPDTGDEVAFVGVYNSEVDDEEK